MGRHTHSHHALLPVLVIQRPQSKLQLLLTSVCLCNHSTPYDSRWRRLGEITYNEPGSSMLSTYRYGICLSILLRIRWVSVTLSLSLTAPFTFFQMGGIFFIIIIPWDFGQFHDACGSGSGITEDQWYLGPLLTI